MPTKHQRIAVVNDEELQEALHRAAPHMPAGTRPATLVHDLAIKGAEALAAEANGTDARIERMIEWSRSGNPPWDQDVLGRVKELAWPHE